MSFSLTNNFFLNARAVTFENSASVTWAFDKNSNQISATAISAIPSGANPSASIGLTTVNGTAVTFMRSDAAPALSQAIVPTWSGLHTFSAGLTISGGAFTLSTHTLTLSANATVGGTNTGDQTLPVAANPTASVGLAVVNGSAATFMRSDAAPALSQAIVPTWSGLHTFNASIAIGNSIFYGTATVTCSVNSTPVTIPSLYPNSGILTVRDNTLGGTNVYIFDPNGGVQLLGVAQIANFSMSLSGSNFVFTATAGSPRTFIWLAHCN